MEAIATITLIAAATCGFALVGILWRAAERADESVETLVQRRRINLVLFGMALVLGILFPLLGITLLAVVVFESLIVHRVPRLARALGAV